MIEHRYLLKVVEHDYDYDTTEDYRANNAYQLRMVVAPRIAYRPAQPAYSYRRGDGISTSPTFFAGPRPDPNEIIRVPAQRAKWWSTASRWDRAVLIDWITRTVQQWSKSHGWAAPISLEEWVAEGGWSL